MLLLCSAAGNMNLVMMLLLLMMMVMMVLIIALLLVVRLVKILSCMIVMKVCSWGGIRWAQSISGGSRILHNDSSGWSDWCWLMMLMVILTAVVVGISIGSSHCFFSLFEGDRTWWEANRRLCSYLFWKRCERAVSSRACYVEMMRVLCRNMMSFNSEFEAFVRHLYVFNW